MHTPSTVTTAPAGAAARLKLGILRPSELEDADMAAWRALQAAYPHLASAFLTPDWTLLLDQIGGPDDGRTKIVVWRDGPQAVGFLPVRVVGGVASAVGGPFNDDQGAIAAPDAGLDLRAALSPLQLGRLDFQNVDTRQGPFDPYRRGRSSVWSIDLSDGFAAYSEALRTAGGQILTDAARKRRKLEREHGEVVFTPFSEDGAAFDQLFAWKRAQLAATRQTDIFRPAWTMAMMRRLFDERREGFGAGLFTLRVAGRLIAAHFAPYGPGVLHVWMIAHEDSFSRYSPGILLMAEMLRWAPEAGFSRIELGPGDYRYKLSLANASRDVSHGFVGRPGPQAFLRGAEYRLRATAEALPLGPLSRLPGKVMRRLDILRALG